MELNFLQTVFLGFISGLSEVLPVSAQAHRLIFLNLFGITKEPAFFRLMVHLAAVFALHFLCRKHIVRMMRAQRLARIPKRKRKRPLDVDALMDFNMLKMTLIPIVAAFFLYSKVQPLAGKLLFLAAFLLLNGVILYIPQFLPGCNKDSGAMSRIDSLLFGLGGALGTLPGVSCVGSAVSIGSVRGMEMNHALNMALITSIPVNLGFALFDLIDLFSSGISGLSFSLLLGSVCGAAAAALGIVLGLSLLKKILERIGYGFFSFYSWGAALFIFVFYLMFA